jgi:hypothetical protein
MLDSIHNFFRYLAHTYLWGWLQLSILGHFFGGMILTLIGLKLKLRIQVIFAVILLLGLIKETFDWIYSNSNFWESLQDILISFIYLILIVIVRKIKRKL